MGKSARRAVLRQQRQVQRLQASKSNIPEDVQKAFSHVVRAWVIFGGRSTQADHSFYKRLQHEKRLHQAYGDGRKLRGGL